MGRAWLSAVEESPDAELVGIVDLDVRAATTAAADLGRPDLPVAADAVSLAAQTGATAVVNVTVPQAHHPVTTAALVAGLAVLGEKPVAQDVAEALSLVAATEITGELFMVSQSRRWNPQLARMRGVVRQLGAVGTVTTEFFRAPRFGGFREEMDQPLLVDMAIHAFDAARYLLGDEPAAASCQSWNPPWSWYAGDASASATFEMRSGARYVYNGSWCSPGRETSWNAEWHVRAERGSVTWDGENDPVTDTDTALEPVATSPYSDIAGSLRLFTEALRSGVTPMGEVCENVMSLAMVEAAVRSAATGRPVTLDEVLDDAHADALRREARDDVREALAGWTSVRAALSSRAVGLPADPG